MDTRERVKALLEQNGYDFIPNDNDEFYGGKTFYSGRADGTGIGVVLFYEDCATMSDKAILSCLQEGTED